MRPAVCAWAMRGTATNSATTAHRNDRRSMIRLAGRRAQPDRGFSASLTVDCPDYQRPWSFGPTSALGDGGRREWVGSVSRAESTDIRCCVYSGLREKCRSRAGADTAELTVQSEQVKFVATFAS